MSQLVEQLIDKFIGKWKSGLEPDMADFVKKVDRDQRGILLRELIKVDVVMRQKYGKPASDTTYARFGPSAAIYAGKKIANLSPSPLSSGKSNTATCSRCDAKFGNFSSGSCPKCGQSLSRSAPSASTGNGRAIVDQKAAESGGENSLAETFIISVDGALLEMRSNTEIRSLPCIGEKLSDRYRLDTQIGRGGMGVVFAGTDMRLERTIAVKFILVNSRSSGTPEMEERFELEAKLGASLRHQTIATVHDYGIHAGLPYCIFEYVSGMSLKDLIAKHAPMAKDDVLPICAQLAVALDYAHAKGIVHRDLKPDNLRFDEHQHIRILDFGLAKRFTSQNDWSFAGTPAYTSPEQANEMPSDGRADQYSLAIIIYEMLTGCRPFCNADWRALLESHRAEQPVAPSKRRAGIPPAIDCAVLKALSKRPDQRFQTCLEFAVALGCSITSVVRRPQKLLLESGAYDHTVSERRSFTLAVKRRVFLGLTSHAVWIVSDESLEEWPRGNISDVQGKSRKLTFTLDSRDKGSRVIRRFRLANADVVRAWTTKLNSRPPRPVEKSPQRRLTARDPVVILNGSPSKNIQVLQPIEASQISAADATLQLMLRAAVLGGNVVINSIRSKDVRANDTLSVITGSAAISQGTGARNRFSHIQHHSQSRRLAKHMLFFFGIVTMLRMLGGLFFHGLELLRGADSPTPATIMFVQLLFTTVPAVLATALLITTWPQFLRPLGAATLTFAFHGLIAALAGLMYLKSESRIAEFNLISAIDIPSIGIMVTGVVLFSRLVSLHRRWLSLPVDVFDDTNRYTQERRRIASGSAWLGAGAYSVLLVAVILWSYSAASRQFADVASLIKSGTPSQLSDMRDELISALKEKPDNDQLFVDLSAIQLAMEDLTGALDSASRALQIRPSKEAYVNQSIAFMGLKRPNEAMEAADRALAISPEEARAYAIRAFSLCVLDRVHESFATFEKAIQFSSQPEVQINQFHEVLVSEGLRKIGEGELSVAIQLLDKAITLRPEKSNAYVLRASAKLDLQQTDDALSDAETALRITPGLPGAHFVRGVVYFHRQNFEGCVADLTLAVDSQLSNEPLAYFFRGTALHALGRTEESKKDLSEFQRLRQARQ